MMQMVFMKLLNMSISAGWLILAVIALRFVFKKAPKNIRCVLWALVAFRLVCPFSFESAVSLIPSAETIPAGIIYERKPNVDTGIEAVDQVVNPVVEYSFAPEELTSVNPIQIALEIGGWIWLVGVAVLLMYALVSYLRLWRRTQISVRLEDNVYICDNVNSALVLGVIKPRIILSSALDSSQYDFVVAHERCHISRLDHLWKPLGFAVLALHWFNPLVWAAYALFCRDIELACDEKVIASMDAEGKRAYSNALLACTAQPSRIMLCPLAFGEVSVKQRIKEVLAYKKAPVLVSLLALVVCAVLAVCFLTDPKGAEAFSPEDIHDLERAELHSEYGDRLATEKYKLIPLADKLSEAKPMEATPACPFEMTLSMTRSDGTEGHIELASDGCEVFCSDSVYYDYGINKTGSVLSTFGFEPFTQERELDEQGRVVKITSFDWFTPMGSEEHSYEGNLIVSTTHKNGKGELQGMEEFEYNEQGWRIRERHYLPDENGQWALDLIIETIYDEQGNFTDSIYYNPDGSVVKTIPGSSEPGLISIPRHG